MRLELVGTLIATLAALFAVLGRPASAPHPVLAAGAATATSTATATAPAMDATSSSPSSGSSSAAQAAAFAGLAGLSVSFALRYRHTCTSVYIPLTPSLPHLSLPPSLVPRSA